MAMGQGEKQHEQRKEHKHVLNILTLLPKVQIEDAFFFLNDGKRDQSSLTNIP